MTDDPRGEERNRESDAVMSWRCGSHHAQEQEHMARLARRASVHVSFGCRGLSTQYSGFRPLSGQVLVAGPLFPTIVAPDNRSDLWPRPDNTVMSRMYLFFRSSVLYALTRPASDILRPNSLHEI